VRGSPLISFEPRRQPSTLRHVLIAAISDTHLPRGRRRLPDACLERLQQADLILHAGDFSTADTLHDLEQIGPPVKAVHGNVDSAELRTRLPESLEISTPGGARIAMLHDAGPRPRRLERMRKRFPDAHAVIFGHSHIPLHEERDGFQIFNPGSPTDRRRQPSHTMGLAHARGTTVTFEHVVLDS
jgi:putative phosphoesterase